MNYEIRTYYKNQDPHCKYPIVYHSYNYYETFEEAYKDFLKYYKIMKNHDALDKLLFAPNMPENLLRPYIEKAINKSIDVVVIVKRKYRYYNKEEENEYRKATKNG